MVAAPTGLAAKNINGKTLHNLLTLPVQNMSNYSYTQDAEPLHDKAVQKKRQELQGKRFLIVDEISMVGAGMLAVINQRLCQIFQCDDIFGGIHVLFAGDFLQLPPVKDRMAFENDLFEELDPIFLTNNMRQKEDRPWCELLDRMSIGNMTEEDMKTLESRMRTDEELDQISADMSLYPTTKEVKLHNVNEQNKLNEDFIKIIATDRYGVNDEAAGHLVDISNLPKKDQDCGGLFKELCISIQSKVMLIRNLIDGLVNGSLGYVEYIEIDETNSTLHIYVKFDDENSGLAMQDPNYDNAIPIKKIDAEFLFKGRFITRTQFPIIPAWSLTIHKAQGQSLKSAIISVENVFAPGQAYVAFSRVQTLNGVYIKGNFKKGKVGSFITSQKAREFLLRKREQYKGIKKSIDKFKF